MLRIHVCVLFVFLCLVGCSDSSVRPQSDGLGANLPEQDVPKETISVDVQVNLLGAIELSSNKVSNKSFKITPEDVAQVSVTVLRSSDQQQVFNGVLTQTEGGIWSGSIDSVPTETPLEVEIGAVDSNGTEIYASTLETQFSDSDPEVTLPVVLRPLDQTALSALTFEVAHGGTQVLVNTSSYLTISFIGEPGERVEYEISVNDSLSLADSLLLDESSAQGLAIYRFRQATVGEYNLEITARSGVFTTTSRLAMSVVEPDSPPQPVDDTASARVDLIFAPALIGVNIDRVSDTTIELTATSSASDIESTGWRIIQSVSDETSPVLESQPEPDRVLIQNYSSSAEFQIELTLNNTDGEARVYLISFNAGQIERVFSKPNIVFIISDDHGWDDYSFMGHPSIETPNIDALARDGMTFTRGYASAPICRPSLASIFTGLYPSQHNITGNFPESDNLQDNAIAIRGFTAIKGITDYLAEEDYLSLQTGKWWEGSWQQNNFTHGMTHGDPDRGGRHGDEGLDIGRETMQPIEDVMDEAIAAEKPFFIWYAPIMPHLPHDPPQDLLDKYLPLTDSVPVAKYWAMVEWFDQTVGQLVDAVEARGLSDNTLIVYTSDNGWQQDPTESRRSDPRSKLSPYDKGLRTPIIYKWPARIAPVVHTDYLSSNVDILPTVLRSLGIQPPSEMLGINVLNFDQLQSQGSIYAESYERFFNIDAPDDSITHRVIVTDTWKLIIHVDVDTEGASASGFDIVDGMAVELFDIETDPYEESNVASLYAEVVQNLASQIRVTIE